MSTLDVRAVRLEDAHGFTVVGTASRHARINGTYVDEILLEKFLPAPTC